MLRTLARRLATFVAAVTLLAGSADAVFAQAGLGTINVDDNGVILRGYDAVAYQTQQQAVRGTAEYTATYDGAIYRFASATNRDAFKTDPARYAPAYGGYCAMGVAVNKKLDGDPEAFSVVSGRLFLNVNRDVRGMWARDVSDNEQKAARNWGRVAVRRGFDTM